MGTLSLAMSLSSGQKNYGSCGKEEHLLEDFLKFMNRPFNSRPALQQFQWGTALKTEDGLFISSVEPEELPIG